MKKMTKTQYERAQREEYRRYVSDLRRAKNTELLDRLTTSPGDTSLEIEAEIERRRGTVYDVGIDEVKS